MIGIDEDLVIPDKSKTIYEGAIAPWRSEKMREWNDVLVKSMLESLIFRSTANITSSPKSSKLFCGQATKYFRGLDAFFKEMEEQTYKIQYRVIAIALPR
jgi:excinuclease ABC subunit A